MGNSKNKVFCLFRKSFMLLPESVIRVYEHWKEHLLRNKYYTDSSDYFVDTSKTLICIIDNKVNPGGLSDRINGMISTYRIAEKLGFDFKILHNTPFNLLAFLEPNNYDWTITPSEINYSKSCSTPIFLRSLVPSRLKLRERSFINSIREKHDCLQFHCYTNLKMFSDSEFSKYFNYLFKPSYILQDAINKNKENIGGKYISITFRFQQLLGDFKEGNFPTLSKEGQLTLIDKCISVIKELYNRNFGYKILVTSDSATFLNIASKLNFVYIIPGKIVHMAFNNDSSVSTHLKAFLDLYMIANADKVYSAIIGPSFDSGFPKLASNINGKPFYKIIRK